MKTLSLVLILLTGLSHNRPVPTIQTTKTSVPDLQKKKDTIDEYLAAHPKQVITLVKVPGKTRLVRIFGKKWPDEIEDTYNILKDASGKIMLIDERPESESGDWDIEYRHYFDSEGRTFAFCRQESTFDDDGNDTIIRERLVNLYDFNFKKIDAIKGIFDQDYKPLRSKKKNFNFRDFPYHIYKDVKSCLKGLQIPSVPTK